MSETDPGNTFCPSNMILETVEIILVTIATVIITEYVFIKFSFCQTVCLTTKKIKGYAYINDVFFYAANGF